MSPSRSIIFILADINERNLDNSNQIVLFRIVVVIPNLEVQIFRFIGNSSPYFKSFVPLRIETSYRITLDLVSTKLSNHISIHIPGK